MKMRRELWHNGKGVCLTVCDTVRFHHNNAS